MAVKTNRASNLREYRILKLIQIILIFSDNVRILSIGKIIKIKIVFK